MRRRLTYERPSGTIGRWPYSLALQLIRWQAARSIEPRPEIWARNSFLTSAFVPFKSDLDLTVWFETEPDAEARRKMARILRRAKRIFPALGECNSYIGGMAAALEPWANRFELQRDPQFSRRLAAPKDVGARPVSENAERTVFLLRMLEIDFHNLVTAPERREAKWRKHFALVGFPAGPLTFAGIPPVEAILSRALGWTERDQGPAFLAVVTSTVETYLRGARLQGKADLSVPLNEIISCAMAHRFSFRRDAYASTKGVLSELALAQLAWETFAMNSQFLFHPDPPGLSRYLRQVSRHLVLAAGVNPLWAGSFTALGRVADLLSVEISSGSKSASLTRFAE